MRRALLGGVGKKHYSSSVYSLFLDPTNESNIGSQHQISTRETSEKKSKEKNAALETDMDDGDLFVFLYSMRGSTSCYWRGAFSSRNNSLNIQDNHNYLFNYPFNWINREACFFFLTCI